VPMQYAALEESRLAGKDHMDVDLVIAGDIDIEIQMLREASFRAIEEYELVDALTVSEQPSKEDIIETDEVAVMPGVRPQCLANFRRKPRCDLLVCVYEQDPGMRKLKVLQGPLLLPRVCAIPLEVNERRS